MDSYEENFRNVGRLVARHRQNRRSSRFRVAREKRPLSTARSSTAGVSPSERGLVTHARTIASAACSTVSARTSPSRVAPAAAGASCGSPDVTRVDGRHRDRSPYSNRSALEYASRPRLLVAHGGSRHIYEREPRQDVDHMARERSRWGSAAAVAFRAPKRFTSITRRPASSGKSPLACAQPPRVVDQDVDLAEALDDSLDRR